MFSRGTYQALVVWQHDDDLSVVVPNHPPKVCGGVWQRMLGNDKLVTPEVTLREHKVRIRSLILKSDYTSSCHQEVLGKLLPAGTSHCTIM